MTSPYRALCAELLAALKSWSPHGGGPLECWEDREEEADLIARAETELAQPEPVGLTDQELLRCAKIATPCCNLKMWERELNMMRAAIAADHARAALAKWGNHPESPDSSTQPIPLSERLPGPEDCDEQGRCWWHRYTPTKEWHLQRVYIGRYSHWLPSNALPTPETAND
jgi:hypothetical protein